ncbi:MAG: hypothetical protein U5O39_05215 [Gammaproteobacteria bacterium]|nr:hypothetical protein [Gammaproteobacteria bacterium]
MNLQSERRVGAEQAPGLLGIDGRSTARDIPAQRRAEPAPFFVRLFSEADDVMDHLAIAGEKVHRFHPDVFIERIGDARIPVIDNTGRRHIEWR